MFRDGCEEPFSFTSRSQPTPSSSDYSEDAEVTFTVNPFKISPSRCTTSYEVTAVARQDLPAGQSEPISVSDLTDTGDGFTFKPTLQQYKDGVYPPGTYDVTFRGFSDEQPDRSDVTRTVSFTLIDPCSTGLTQSNI